MDAEIKQILDQPEGNTARDRVELSLGLGNQIEIAGKLLPAPAAAVFAMLELIGSPFVVDEVEVTDLAVFHALYVLSEREKAVAPVLRWQRREEALERLKNEFAEQADPQTVLILGNMLNQIADAKAEFDLAAIQFCDKNFGKFNIADAASEIGFYLSLAGGFEMLPNDGADSKKNDITTLTS